MSDLPRAAICSNRPDYCEECNPSAAKVPFDKILDFVTDSNPAITDSILEPPAKCPNCKREIREKTLVEPLG